jgi:hypothetical protein
MNSTDARFFSRAIILNGVALLAVVVLVTWVGASALSGLRTQALHACERANVQRAEDNASHYADYHVDSFVYQRFSIPTKTETTAQKTITAAFANTLKDAVDAKSWVPLTDCQASAGSDYKAPQPIPFTRGRLLMSALDPINATLPNPRGSRP